MAATTEAMAATTEAVAATTEAPTEIILGQEPPALRKRGNTATIFVRKNTLVSMSFPPIDPETIGEYTIDKIKVQSEALFETVDEAVKATVEAQNEYANMPLNTRKDVIEAIRKVCMEYTVDLAWCCWHETKRGRKANKCSKMQIVARKTPGCEDLQPVVTSGDNGMTVTEYAPYGVFGSVTPVTNPGATVFNNAISLLAGGNGVVFNPHPAATWTTCRAIAIVHEAVVGAGGPKCLVTGIWKPTVAGAQELFTHPLTHANLVTGGPAVVKVALTSGKRSFCAGPGNPPVVVDETADLALAAKGLIDGASFDNNMICSDEKEVFVVKDVYEKYLDELLRAGARILTDEELEKVMKVIFEGETAPCCHATVNRDLVGQDAREILRVAGVIKDDEVASTPDYPLLVAKVGKEHPLVWTEQLMPVIPVCSMESFDEAVKYAKQVEYGFKHTASIYSSRVDRITSMGKLLGTSIFVANGPHYTGLAVGGEGYTSFSIAGTTGEGLTRPRTFCRERRVVVVNAMRFV